MQNLKTFIYTILKRNLQYAESYFNDSEITLNG